MTSEFKNGVLLKDCILSNKIIELYNSADVQNVNGATVVLFHAFLLESGFIPKDVAAADVYKCMPKDWNAGGIFKIKYSHDCCTQVACHVSCVPLYNKVSVHGIVCDMDYSESMEKVVLQVDLKKYLKQKRDLSNVHQVFNNLDELSRYFKDNFCLPLLNLLHESAGIRRLYGFPGLFDELKLFILRLLPVESVVSMSAVNKNLSSLANSPFLWKYLWERDFAKGGLLDVATSSKTDWKELYKKEYAKKRLRPEARRWLINQRLPYVIPDFYGFDDFKPLFDFTPWSGPGSTQFPPPFSRKIRNPLKILDL